MMRPPKKLKESLELKILRDNHFPFQMHVFPEEIWGLIMDELEDGIDIQNTMHAFPNLSAAFEQKKPIWLFSEVLPFIFNQICTNYQPVLDMRQVCKRWCYAVDNFLENHPYRRPYQTGGPNRRTVIYRDFTYQSLTTFPICALHTAKDIQKMHMEMHGHLRNPFVGRVVKLTRQVPEAEEEGGPLYHENVLSFLYATLKFLQEFGHHIWYASLDFGGISTFYFGEGRKIYSNFVACLKHMPNVRQLGIGLDTLDSMKSLDDNFIKGVVFLKLQKLESIEVFLVNKIVSQAVTYHIGEIGGYARVTKLEVGASTQGYSQQLKFPNLCEITVDCSLENSYKMLWKILRSLRSRPLKRLKILPSIFTPLNINQPFNFLPRMNIEEFVVENHLEDSLTSSKIEAARMPKITCVKYLRIYDAKQLSFEFLKALPCLEHLHVQCKIYSLKTEFLFTCKTYDVLTTLVKKYLYLPLVPAKSCIWKVLPTLRLLTVEERFSRKQFAREYGNVPFHVNQ